MKRLERFAVSLAKKVLPAKLLEGRDVEDLLGASFTALLLRGIGVLLFYGFLAYIGRTQGPGATGVFSLAFTVLSIFGMLAAFGLDMALLREVSRHRESNQWGVLKDKYLKAVLLVVVLGAVLSSALFLGAQYVATVVFSVPALAQSLRVAAVAVIPFSLILVHMSALRGLQRIDLYAVRDLLVNGLALVALVLFADWLLPISAYLIGVIAAAVVLAVNWWRVSKLRTVTAKSTPYAELLGLSWPLLITGSMFLIMQWTDHLMLGFFADEVAVGVYTVAFKLATATSFALFAVNALAAPRFAQYWQRGEKKELQQAITSATRMITVVSVPVLVLTAVFGKFFLSLFGQEFVVGWLAMIILVVGQFVNVISGSVGYFLMMTGKEKAFRNILLLAASLNIVMNIVLIPLYGIVGAAIASAGSMMVWNLSSVVYAWKQSDILTLVRF